jgi:NAD(P)-dependent dehydrogenase (short-subunit alcohol dehydrogenase family)
MAGKKRSVVVTGASSGIGHAAVQSLIKAGFRVYGSVRKDEDAKRLAAEFGADFAPLVFDVTDEKAVKTAAARVRSALEGETLAGLVNNAGIAVAGPLVYLPVEEFRRQLDVNLTGVVVTTQAFAPLLGVDRSLKGKPGRIINISSGAGRKASPFLGPYAASKFGLEGLSEALRQEMMVFGIDVVVVAPGSVATPIWDKAGELDVTPYATTAYAKPIENVRFMAIKQGKAGLPAEKLGQVVVRSLTARWPQTRYAVSRPSIGKLILSLLSQRTIDRITANAIGLKRMRR